MLNDSAKKRCEEFLKICGQFRLGDLVTEGSHPVTANLSEVATRDISEALRLLFEVNRDVVAKYREWAKSGVAKQIARSVLDAIRGGGRAFFVGCGSTGRLSIVLDSIWREFWRGRDSDLAARTVSVMAGGDFALIKSVEGFEDITEFGRRQIADKGVSQADVVFCITEGGETSFVIGAAWQALESGAKVYFVYNNPDDVLVEHVERSRRVIEEPGIEKINLTTGPMAITGSTRMQATTIQLCAMLTVLEMVARELKGSPALDVPGEMLAGLEEVLANLSDEDLRSSLAALVALEESVYRSGHRNNYFADAIAIDVLTDTTERSPTYCTPPFAKCDNKRASKSWAFLFLPYSDTPTAWKSLLKREVSAVEWDDARVRQMVNGDRAERVGEIMRGISGAELMKFKIGLDGLAYRPLGPCDSAVAVLAQEDLPALLARDGFFRTHLEDARERGAGIGVVAFGEAAALREAREFVHQWNGVCVFVPVPLPQSRLLLGGVARAG